MIHARFNLMFMAIYIQHSQHLAALWGYNEFANDIILKENIYVPQIEPIDNLSIKNMCAYIRSTLA